MKVSGELWAAAFLPGFAFLPIPNGSVKPASSSRNEPRWEGERPPAVFVPPAFSLENEQAFKARRATKARRALVDVGVKGLLRLGEN